MIIDRYPATSPSRVRPKIRLMAGASSCPHVGRGCAVTPAKSPVEIGQVIEAEFERNHADLAMKIERVSQKAVGARQALAEHEFRVGEVLALEQLVQIALGHRIACRDLRDAEFGIVKIGKHVGLDCCQPGRADGRSFGKLLACALASKALAGPALLLQNLLKHLP